jgi:hypothetical protein
VSRAERMFGSFRAESPDPDRSDGIGLPAGRGSDRQDGGVVLAAVTEALQQSDDRGDGGRGAEREVVFVRPTPGRRRR